MVVLPWTTATSYLLTCSHVMTGRLPSKQTIVVSFIRGLVSLSFLQQHSRVSSPAHCVTSSSAWGMVLLLVSLLLTARVACLRRMHVVLPMEQVHCLLPRQLPTSLATPTCVLSCRRNSSSVRRPTCSTTV